MLQVVTFLLPVGITNITINVLPHAVAHAIGSLSQNDSCTVPESVSSFLFSLRPVSINDVWEIVTSNYTIFL